MSAFKWFFIKISDRIISTENTNKTDYLKVLERGK
jgi:hypothetical protein